MKIKNILYVFLWINIVVASNIHTMEQPTEQPLHRAYPSYLPLLLLYGWNFEESCLSKLPPELIVELINHMRKIQNDQDLLSLRNGEDLLNAMKIDDKDKIRQLLNEPYIDINVKDEYGYAPLIWATKSNNSKIVKILLNKGANPNMQDNRGDTPLIWAVNNNNPEIIRILLGKGANPNIQNRNGHTPLIWAARNNKPEIVRILLDKGADPNIAGNDRYTPLDWATSHGTQAIINLIIKAKEKLDCTCNQDLLKAVKANDENEVRRLLNEPYINTNVKDEKGYTPLILAVRNNNPEIVQILLNNGADPDIPDEDDWTPLYWAAEKDNEAIINLIIEAKEKLDSVGTSGS